MNEPKLKFPEFSGEWEEKKLGECFELLTNSTLSRSDLNNITGKALYIHYGDILTKFGETLDVQKMHLPYITNDTIADKACKSTLKNGDVIIADTAEDDMVGKCTEIRNIGITPIVSGLHTIPVRPLIEFASGFMGYYLNSESYRADLYSLMQGVKVMSISRTAIIGTNVKYPSLILEQEKIASCLSAMDDLIAAQAEKVEALKEKKTGLMQQLFPQPSEKKPRLRFPEFTGEWEEKTLGEVSPVIFDGTHQTPHYVNSGIPFYSIENIVSDKPCKYIAQDEHMSNTKKNKTEKGDILITRIGTIGFAKIVDWDGEFSTYVSLATIKKSSLINTRYLLGYLQSEVYQKEMRSKSLMNAVPCKINMEDLKNTRIAFPKEPKEQQKIASCLSALDDQIAAETEKLTALKDYKKGLMQQLFPQPAK